MIKGIFCVMKERPKEKTIYKEFTKYQNDSITNYETIGERIQKTHQNFKLCQKKLEDLYRKYYILQLFEKTTNMEESFYEDFKMMDNYLLKTQSYFDDVKKINNQLTGDMPSSSIVDGYYKVCDLLDVLDEVKGELNRFEKHYYPEFKMTSYNTIKDKTKDEIKKLAKAVNEYIDGYNSLQDAYDFICYNSGDNVVETVGEFVNELKKKQDKLKIRIEKEIFLQSDVVMFMDYLDWVNLFSKFQYVFERVDRSMYKSEKVDNLLNELLIRYLVVLVYNEKRNR